MRNEDQSVQIEIKVIKGNCGLAGTKLSTLIYIIVMIQPRLLLADLIHLTEIEGES